MMKTSASIECLIYQTVFSDSKFIGIKGSKARSKIATIEDRNISSSMYSSNAASTIDNRS